MKSAKLTAIIYAVILSLLLLIPALTIRFVDHDARKAWENRTLTERPTLAEIRESPKQGFKDFDDYLNDHIGGSFQSIKFRRKFYFDVFNATGDTYIVGKNDGALFLTAPFQQPDRDTPFQWWEKVCEKLQVAGYQRNYLKRVEASKAMLSSRGANVIYSSIPTTPVLNPDQFPRSTPAGYKEACAAVTPENNHIVKMREMDPETNFFYPLRAFQERSKDPFFYPNSAYHWQGESTWVFIEELSKEYNFDLPKTWPGKPCEYQDVPWDIGTLIGVGETTKGCDRDKAQLGIIVEDRFKYPLSAKAIEANPRKTHITVVKMTNPHAESDQSAIIFSNSFGPAVREQYASLFKTTYHLRLGIINTPDMKLLLRESDVLDVDTIIIAIGDFHYPGFLAALE